MRLLLDTHIAIWAVIDDPKLSDTARRLIADLGNEVYVSVVSLWEISIKHARVRTKPSGMPVTALMAHNAFQAAGYRMLEMTPAHVHALANLAPIHNDPFDRMLLAQAYEVPLRLLTHDQVMPLYGDYVLGV